MRIKCPYCGERNASEFVYKGDAAIERPQVTEAEAFFEFVYRRDNLAGPMREFWFHSAGCHAWLIVTRHTVSHHILGVEAARPALLSSRRGAS